MGAWRIGACKPYRLQKAVARLLACAKPWTFVQPLRSLVKLLDGTPSPSCAAHLVPAAFYGLLPLDCVESSPFPERDVAPSNAALATNLVIEGKLSSQYAGDWHESGQIPLREVHAGRLNRFGTIDPNRRGGLAVVGKTGGMAQKPKYVDHSQRIRHLPATSLRGTLRFGLDVRFGQGL
jgi:hypothetical protein